MNTLQDRIRGSFIGGAAGDAMGVGAEFLDQKEVASRNPHGIRHYSDI